LNVRRLCAPDERSPVVVASPPDEFAKFFKAELAKRARVINQTGIKAD
jgi:hypothetical protein